MWFRCSLLLLKQCIIIHAAERKMPYLTAKQPPLQRDTVDLSHRPRSPLLSMQVTVSSSMLDASPDLLHHLFSGKPGILDILQRLKDKGPLSTNKVEPCTLPEWELKMSLCGCSLEEQEWCAGQEFQLQLLMTGRGHHCSMRLCPTNLTHCQHFLLSDIRRFQHLYSACIWQERRHVWNHFSQ